MKLGSKNKQERAPDTKLVIPARFLGGNPKNGSPTHFRRRTTNSSRILSEMSDKLISESIRAKARSEVLRALSASVKTFGDDRS